MSTFFRSLEVLGYKLKLYYYSWTVFEVIYVMTGVGVVDIYVNSLLHVVCKRESVLVVNCFDYVLDFFIPINQSNELFDLIWPCGEVDYRLDGKRIPVFPEVPPLL